VVGFDGTPRVGGGELPDVRGLTPAAARLLDDSIHDFEWGEIPPGVDQLSFQAPSGRLAGLGAGNPAHPRVLLAPGVTGSKEDFALMVPLLVRAGYRVESYDLAGQNHSAGAGPERLVPPRRHYDHDLFVGDLEAVVLAGRRPVHLLGYSFAGTVAQLLAVKRPELVASLTLLSIPPVPGQAFRKTKNILGPLSRVTNGRAGASLMLWGIRHNFNRVPEARYDYVMRRMPITRRESVDDIVSLMRRTPDLREAVRALPIPKLVAFGSHDLWPTRTHAEYAAAIGAQAAEYDTGHSPCETAPHQLVRDMVRVIEGG
jgi:pimeloyl-ACP methyl ester carboxylesterase